MAKFCANCGAQMGENEKFCGSCGAKVEELQPAGQNTANGENAQQVQQNVQPQQTAPIYQQSNIGTPGTPAPEPAPAAPKGPNPAVVWIKGHKSLLIVLSALIVLAVVAIIILVNIFKYQVIDPKDIASVQFYGVDTDGNAAVTLDDRDTMRSYYLKQVNDSKSAFDYDFYQNNIKDIKPDKCSDYFNDELSKDETLKVWTKASNLHDADRMKSAVIDKVKFKLDKTSGLKNGEKIKVSVVYDKDSLAKKNVKLSSDEFEVEVKGLKKAETIDMFKGVSLKTEGYNGAARLTQYSDNFNSTVSVKVPEDSFKFIKYSYKDETDYDSKLYSNGDEVEITAKLSGIYDNDLHKTKKGYWFKYDKNYYFVTDKESTKKFKVSGLKDPQEIDVFQDVKIEYDGVSPKVEIRGASLPEDCAYSDALKFSVEAKDELKTNETFKVYVRVDPEELASEGYKAAGESNSTAEDFKNHYDGYFYSEETDKQYLYYVKEYTVDNTYAYYISTKEDALASEETFKPDFNSAISKFKDRSYISVMKGKNDSTYIDVKKYSSFTYINSYIAYTNAEDANPRNYVIRMYKAVLTDDDKKPHTVYVALYKRSVMMKNGAYESSYDDVYYSAYATPTVLTQDFSKVDDAKYSITKYKNPNG